MPLTEHEELELLELERERALSSGNFKEPETTTEQPKPKRHWLESVFPGTVESVQRGGSIPKNLGAAIGDVLSFTDRTTGTARSKLGLGGDMELADKDAFFFKPEAEKIKAKIEEEGVRSPMRVPTLGSFTVPYSPGKEEAKAVTDLSLSSINPLDIIAPIKKGISAGLKVAGESVLKSQMKPKDVTSLLAGKNVEEGVNKLVKNISKYNVESPVGGFSGISKKASRKITENIDMADNAIKNALKNTPDASVNIDDTFLQFMDDLKSGRINDVFGDEEQAEKIASNIYNGLELRGLTGEQSIDKIPEIKKVITKYGGGLFKKGKYNIAADPLKNQVGELSYLRLTKELEGKVPEIKKFNDAAHDLIIIRKASDEAAKRIGNRDKIGLTDWMLLFGGPTAASQLGLSQAAAGAIQGSIFIGKKALGSGRGPSASLQLSKALETIPFPVKTGVGTVSGYHSVKEDENERR